MKTKLLIIGAVPRSAGIGGVTIHVSRLLDYLDKERFDYSFVDYKTLPLLRVVKEIITSKIIHFHISNPFLLFPFVLFAKIFFRKVILTLHGNYGRFNTVKNLLVKCSIILCDYPITINENSYKQVSKFKKNTMLFSAFIPPIKQEKLDKGIINTIERLHECFPIIVSTNAFNISIDKEGNDVYGIDFLIKVFSQIKDKALLISDPSGNYSKKYADVPINVAFINYKHSYFELLKRIDIFVRNTSTDGDALSVKEALFLNIPTLCTNVVSRPCGVVLFEYGNIESFINALNNAKETKEHFKIANAADQIIQLYQQIIN